MKKKCPTHIFASKFLNWYMKSVKIGRESDNDVIVNDPKERVSRHHAVIRLHDDGRISIIDDSSNGTSVNDVPIPRGREVFISRKDKVTLAGTHSLNWKKVLTTNQNWLTSITNTTNFPKEIRQFLDQVFSFGPFGESMRNFFGILTGGAGYVLALSKTQESQKKEAVGFFAFGLGAAVLCIANSDVHGYNLFEGILNRFNAGKITLIREISLSLILALIAMMVAILNYKLFKIFTNSKNRWEQYLVMYCYIAGTFFWLIAIVVGSWLIFLSDSQQSPENFFTTATYYLILFATLWAIITWLVANAMFWD